MADEVQRKRIASPSAPVRRKSYIRIDKKLLRVCIACKRKNARVKLICMTRTDDGHARLRRGAKTGKAVTACDRKSCIAKALEKKRYDYWIKVPLDQTIEEARFGSK